MRVFRLTFSLFYDPYWRDGFRRSWRTRRYWLAVPATRALNRRALALQLGPLTFKLSAQGPDRRSPDNG
jgi:hypothetical protein